MALIGALAGTGVFPGLPELSARLLLLVGLVSLFSFLRLAAGLLVSFFCVSSVDSLIGRLTVLRNNEVLIRFLVLLIDIACWGVLVVDLWLIAGGLGVVVAPAGRLLLGVSPGLLKYFFSLIVILSVVRIKVGIVFVDVLRRLLVLLLVW